MTYNKRDNRGRKPDEQDAEHLDKIAILSFIGRGASFLYDVVTFFVPAGSERRQAQDVARRMERGADKLREIEKRQRSQHRDNNPWR